jgi:hypothetical protein
MGLGDWIELFIGVNLVVSVFVFGCFIWDYNWVKMRLGASVSEYPNLVRFRQTWNHHEHISPCPRIFWPFSRTLVLSKCGLLPL